MGHTTVTFKNIRDEDEGVSARAKAIKLIPALLQILGGVYQTSNGPVGVSVKRPAEHCLGVSIDESFVGERLRGAGYKFS